MCKVFVVSTLYQEKDNIAENHNVGVFNKLEDAQVALENAFHENCDALGIEELNKYSFFDEVPEEGMLPSFYLCDNKDEEFMCLGTINCLEMNKEYRDTDKYENPNEEDMEQVKNLKELIGRIKTNLDESGEPVEVVVLLNNEVVSRKTITFGDEDDTFNVFNFADDTMQTLTMDELFDNSKTNIGRALEVGALYYILN